MSSQIQNFNSEGSLLTKNGNWIRGAGAVLGQSIIGARGALRGLGLLHATPDWHEGSPGVQDGGSEVQRGLALD